MSTLQDGSLALRANVLFASTALRLEPILDKCFKHILGTIGLIFLCIPETALLANVGLRWSALRVLMGALRSVYLPREYFDPEFRRRLWTELKLLSHPRILAPRLQNIVIYKIDEARYYYDYFTSSKLHLIYDNTTEGSPLRRLIVDTWNFTYL
jgi:hypothetical protein